MSREQGEGRSVTAVRVLGIGLEVPPDLPACDLLAVAADMTRLVGSALFVERADDSRMFTASELSALSMAADTALSLIEAAEAVRRARA